MQYSDFKVPSTFAQQHLFYSDGIGIETHDKFKIDRQSFRNNVLMYVLKGVFYVEQKGIRRLVAGDLVVMRLSEPHKYYTSSSDVATILWMHFGCASNPELMNYIESEVGLPYVTRDESIRKNIETCLEASKENSIHREYIYSTMTYKSLLSLCDQINNRSDRVDLSAKSEFIMKINAYIESHMDDKPVLGDIANACGISKYHFTKLFKLYLGQSPIHYYYKIKIERSKGRLSYTGESIGSIAVNMGFDNQSHFSKVFKRIVGMSPNAYRKQGL